MKVLNRSFIAACLGMAGLLWFSPSQTAAEVTLPAVFGNNMVLQRDIPVPVWGQAKPGEKVSVTFAGRTKQAVADKDGKWKVTLDALKVGKAGKLTVSGSNPVAFSDVVVGEVWVCSGQSNMAFRLSGVVNAKTEIAAAKFPLIRTMNMRGKRPPGGWTVCGPQTAGGFTGTGFFFARKIHQELKVPVGLINSSVGGTPIEAWTSVAAQKKLHAARSKDPKWKLPAPNDRSGNLYRSMIAPVIPYAIRGAIWYQGERNAKATGGYEYRHQLPAMIEDWRQAWGQGDFPFGFVQLPNIGGGYGGWVTIRDSMRRSLRVANTGMAVTIDTDPGSLHPKNKQDVGKRLALWALATVYGEKDLVYSGPLYKGMKNEGKTIRLSFDHVGGGLVAKGGELRMFQIAGADGKFVPATAKISADTVVVTSDRVAKPTAVRYAWAGQAIKANLYNKAGLPASPFHTDE